MRRPEVVQLLRDAEGKVTLVVSRQEAVEEQEPDTVHVSVVCVLKLDHSMEN